MPPKKPQSNAKDILDALDEIGDLGEEAKDLEEALREVRGEEDLPKPDPFEGLTE